jgi:hypothetical protein
MVFICFREATMGGDFDYYAGAEKVDMSPLMYGDPLPDEHADISAHTVVAKIRERFPDFAPAAYLNGTEKPDSFKWLLSGRLGTRDKVYGYIGPKMIEMAQAFYHMATGRYLAYASPKWLRRGRSMLALAPFDRGVRQVAKRAILDPRLWFRRLHFQSIMIIQPVDVLEDGRQNMCDGCPDMTVWNGRLAWSCRLEECHQFGQFVRTVPKHDGRRLPIAERV